MDPHPTPKKPTLFSVELGWAFPKPEKKPTPINRTHIHISYSTVDP
jgi:hypothetical protein